MENLQKSWRIFLLEFELAKHYHYPYMLDGIGSASRNPLLDGLLPSLLYVRMVSILDDALKIKLETIGISLPAGPYRSDLNGRICISGEQGIVTNKDQLSALRLRRNELAHGDSKSDWNELHTAVNLVEVTLQGLGFVGSRPSLEYFGERSAIEESPDPEVSCTQHFKCGIRENGKTAIEFSWSTNLY